MPYTFHRKDGDRLRRLVAKADIEAQILAKRATLAADLGDIPLAMAVKLVRVEHLLTDVHGLCRGAFDLDAAAPGWRDVYATEKYSQQSFERMSRLDGRLTWRAV